ncbi:MAG: GPW/gp25 family protein [Janthinobacterium lividum]
MQEITGRVYGRGWQFPVAFTRAGVTLAQNGEADVEQSLRVLFGTQPGERIMRPDFGCDLQSAVFENVSESLRADLRARIVDSVLRYETRAVIVDVDIAQDAVCPTRLRVRVTYRLRGADTTRSLDGVVGDDDGEVSFL